MRARKGQIAIYLVMVLVVIALLTLLNVDTFTAVRAKNRLQNAGDAAALAAARKQGALINEIGSLNLRHVVAAVRNDARECEEAVAEARRLALLGPVDALRLANEAARKNGMETRREFSEILEAHVKDIRIVYAAGGGGAGDPYPEPFPGAWTDYATAIANVAAEGLATGPDNIEFYYAHGGHLLLNLQFYHAVAGRDWCWFFFNAMSALEGYSSYHDWDPLPARRGNSMDNSEIYSLHLKSVKCALTDVFTREEVRKIVEAFTDERVTDEELAKSALVSDREQVWFFFDAEAWVQWFDGRRLCGEEGGVELPIVGEIKREYNVRGCAAVNRCASEQEAVAVERNSRFTWVAAAKPFGRLEDLEGEAAPVTALRRFVVPCMSSVRLVPIDSVGGQNLGTADYLWVVHLREHLPRYLEKGPRSAAGCYYCQQLATWERDFFRMEGVNWLKYNSGTCVRPTGGGPIGSGGTTHGH